MQPHGLQHARVPCPSPTSGACSNSCPSTISFSVIPFSSCLQSFPASGSFQMSQFFTSGCQSIGVSASASVLPMNIQNWFPLGWTGWISLQSSISSSVLSFLYSPNSHIHNGKTIAFTRRSFVGKVMPLLFNMLSELVITFLPRSNRLLISWLQSPSAVILEPPIIKSVTVSIVYPFICPEVMGPDAMILVFWILSFKPTFSLSSFTLIKRIFSSSLLSVIRMVVIYIFEVVDICPGNLDSILCFIQPGISHEVLCI